MPKAWTAPVAQAALARVREGAWFVDMYCEDRLLGSPATLHGCGLPEAFEYDDGAGGVALYEGLGGQLAPPPEVVAQLGAVAEPLSFNFEAGAILDNSSFIGRFSDRRWHQRPIRARFVLFSGNFTTALGVVCDWTGIMDRAPFAHSPGAAATRELVCESGARRLRSANPHYRTPVNHALFAPGDRFCDHTATALSADLPWATKKVAPHQQVR